MKSLKIMRVAHPSTTIRTLELGRTLSTSRVAHHSPLDTVASKWFTWVMTWMPVSIWTPKMAKCLDLTSMWVPKLPLQPLLCILIHQEINWRQAVTRHCGKLSQKATMARFQSTWIILSAPKRHQYAPILFAQMNSVRNVRVNGISERIFPS